MQRNRNHQLRLKALAEIAALRDPEAFDDSLEVVATWPRDERRAGAKVLLQALVERRIGRRDQAQAWVWRLAAITRELHEEYAVQRWPETKRLLGLFVNSSGRAHGRNARRIVHAARQQDRRLAISLLAAAVAHTPEAEEVLARRPNADGPQALRRRPRAASQLPALWRKAPPSPGQERRAPAKRRWQRRQEREPGRQRGQRTVSRRSPQPSRRPTRHRADRPAQYQLAEAWYRLRVDADSKSALPGIVRAREERSLATLDRKREAPGLEMQLEEQGDRVLVRAWGEIDFGSASTFEVELRRAIKANAHGVMLDLRGVTFIDSTGLQVLASAATMAQARRRELTLLDASPQVQHVIEMSGLQDLLPLAG